MILFKLKKIWTWMIAHWQIPFLVIWTIVVWIVTRRNTGAIIEAMKIKKESYREQVEVLRTSHNNELLKRDKLIKEYEESLDKIETEFEKKKQKLSEKQKNEIKEVIIKSKGNPDEIKKRIEAEFGIKFV